MSNALIYLDESGDLGWNFDKPYREGGSSRFLTIASLVINPSKKHLTKRLIKNLYNKFKWPPKIEKKWSDMKLSERERVLRRQSCLIKKPKLKRHSIPINYCT